jgi:hypothetical protein
MPDRQCTRAMPGGAQIFHRLFTRLGCRGRPPQFFVEFYPYAGLSHTIRVSGDTARVRLSDLLRGAPLPVLEAAAAVLLARLYRRPLPSPLAQTYRKFAVGPVMHRRVRRARLARVRHNTHQVEGARYDLAPLFAGLNRRYFAGRLRRPRLGWSLKPWRARLGYFDPALDLIVLNRRLDREDVPRYAVEFVLFHEMLHIKHPRRVCRGGRCGFQIHSPSFRREEKRYAAYERAQHFLRRF